MKNLNEMNDDEFAEYLEKIKKASMLKEFCIILKCSQEEVIYKIQQLLVKNEELKNERDRLIAEINSVK